MKIRFPSLLALSCLTLSPFTLAQHADHDAGATPASEVGSENVTFATSCDAGTTDLFNRGVALLHSFWFPEAIATFGQVLQQDPQCAMAYWGIALGNWNNPFAGQRTAAQLTGGQEAIEAAQRTGSPTPRERAYIEAAAELFSDNQPGTQGARTQAYERAMEQLTVAFPDDIEARIFYALAVNQTASPNDKTYSQQLKAAQILEPMYMTYPSHPGLAHYIIHAYDHPPLAGRALDAATRYASLAPAVPHALHMPSHTFTRLGMWQESVTTNQKSADTARANGIAGEELHALDYQAYGFLQMAQDQKALAVVDRVRELLESAGVAGVIGNQAGAFALNAIPARYALERGDFTAAAALTVTPVDAAPHTQAITHFARALGAARSGQPRAAAEDIDMLVKLRDTLRDRQDAYWTEQVDIQWQVARAWVAFAEGSHETAIDALRAAADAEDATDKAAISPGPLAPARELLGMMLLEAGQPAAALVALETAMAKEPNRFLPIYSAARAALASGDADKANRYFEQLLQVASSADTERPELVEARNALAAR
jgi:tetratricopeptide (TPR) repeat protein